MGFKDFFKKSVESSVSDVNDTEAEISRVTRQIAALGIYGTRDDDESPKSYDSIYTLYKSDDAFFNETNDVATQVAPDYSVVSKDGDEEDNEGVKAIREWEKTYNMHSEILRFLEELTRDRRFGTSYGEIITLKNPLVNKGNPITCRLASISPLSVQETYTERDKFGRLIYFAQQGTSGLNEWKGLKECKDIIIIRWNENEYSKTGVSQIVPCYDNINSFKNQRLFVDEILKRDMRPLVFHNFDGDGIGSEQAKKHIADYKTMIDNTRAKKMFDIFRSLRWTTDIKGYQGQMIDWSPLARMFNQRRHSALRYPDFNNGEGTNKATIETIKSNWDYTKIRPTQMKLIREFLEPLYDRVLNELGLPNAPRPTIKFDPFTSLNALEQAQTDLYYTQMLGPYWEKVVAEKMGIRNYDENWRIERPKAQQEALPKELRQDGIRKTDSTENPKQGKEKVL